MTRLEPLLQRAGALLNEARDVVLGRVEGPDPPGWCTTRGWEAFLLGLDEPALRRCEAEGLCAAIEDLPAAPASLRALCAEVRALLTALPCADPSADPGADPALALRGASPRKQAQVAALVRWAGRGSWSRVVDVGAGRGHLTRELARALGAPALGLEREPQRVRAATALAGDAPVGDAPVAFQVADALAGPLPLRPGDLLVGLHACGRLSDVLVEAAARARVDLLLVGCCLQKTAAPAREPVSAQGRRLGLSFPRAVLGLANLHDHVPGAGEITDRSQAGRATRQALRALLRARGASVAAGEELRGLPRWGLRRGLEVAAGLALAARGLPPASPAELRAAATGAAAALERTRRLALPRAALGRPLELAVALDRARALEEAGLATTVEVAFGLAHGPRNLLVRARV
mgnify:CR=1 FL=1